MEHTFKNIGPSERNVCSACLMNNTNMCPKNYEFLGVYMHAPEVYHAVHTCHRFLISPDAKIMRFIQLKAALERNIEYD